MKRVLFLYVPVLHEGYLKLFEKYRDQVDALYLLGEDIIIEFSSFKKEIRALSPEVSKIIIASLNIFPVIKILTLKNLHEVKNVEIFTAEDELSKQVIRKYFGDNKIFYESVFLRWDAKNVQSSTDVQYDRISTAILDQKMCMEAANEAEKSSDWWRHVGAIVTKNGEVLFKNHNHHIPSDHTPYINGDPRDVIKAGTLNLMYTSLHAEQSIIAEAARTGVSLEGSSMYLNIFPCPLCAKLIAGAGITQCFFKSGSAWLDAESVLRASGIEIILVTEEQKLSKS